MLINPYYKYITGGAGAKGHVSLRQKGRRGAGSRGGCDGGWFAASLRVENGRRA
jgi:hypothetical protein